MAFTAQELAVRNRDVVYPESDGEPVGETDFHIGAIFYLRMALRWLFRERHDVYVAADMLLYYEQGEPASRVSPDVFAVQGVSRHDRRTYRLWEEGVVPCLAIEITSRSSRIDDVGTKRGLYEMLGVAEYLIFDPLGEYLDPRLRVFSLEQGVYRPANLSASETYQSRVLPVAFQGDGSLLRVIDPATGIAVPLLEEATDAIAEALRSAEAEASRAKTEASRAEAEASRAEAEASRAEAEASRAKTEASRADSLDAIVRRYREKFGDIED